MLKAAVVLSGCGYLDGAEITEAVSALIALDRAGVETLVCAPEMDQLDVVDHLRGEPIPGKVRNVLSESARIARGKIQDIKSVTAVDFDTLVFPGGFGAAKNLSSFAEDGANCVVHPEVERLILEAFGARKPIVAICIAPALLARVIGGRGAVPLLTIGNDEQTALALDKMGARHQNCSVLDCVVDEANRLVTTPAYMLAKGPGEVFEGIDRAIQAMVRLATS
ncbi:isoprenoid biosynthesis glyoxalase ElbB [bacterium]|nr:isoprenoid biosynthesis glyoxalase ElbB [bacterium]